MNRDLLPLYCFVYGVLGFTGLFVYLVNFTDPKEDGRRLCAKAIVIALVWPLMAALFLLWGAGLLIVDSGFWRWLKSE